jgi:hypothetical protein
MQCAAFFNCMLREAQPLAGPPPPPARTTPGATHLHLNVLLEQKQMWVCMLSHYISLKHFYVFLHLSLCMQQARGKQESWHSRTTGRKVKPLNILSICLHPVCLWLCSFLQFWVSFFSFNFVYVPHEKIQLFNTSLFQPFLLVYCITKYT